MKSGFESALDQYLPGFEKQTGIEIRYEKTGTQPGTGPRGRHPSVSRDAGGAEQRRAAFASRTRAAVRLRYLAGGGGAGSGG